MPKQPNKKKRKVSRLKQARGADEFNARAYFLSLPEEPPKPPAPEAEFDARAYFLETVRWFNSRPYH